MLNWVVDSCPVLLSITALPRKPKAREDHPTLIHVLFMLGMPVLVFACTDTIRVRVLQHF
jgi:hypothetical protein